MRSTGLPTKALLLRDWSIWRETSIRIDEADVCIAAHRTVPLLYEDAEWQGDIHAARLLAAERSRLRLAQVMRVGWQRLATRGLVGVLYSLTRLTALPPNQDKSFIACANQMS